MSDEDIDAMEAERKANLAKIEAGETPTPEEEKFLQVPNVEKDPSHPNLSVGILIWLGSFSQLGTCKNFSSRGVGVSPASILGWFAFCSASIASMSSSDMPSLRRRHSVCCFISSGVCSTLFFAILHLSSVAISVSLTASLISLGVLVFKNSSISSCLSGSA